MREYIALGDSGNDAASLFYRALAEHYPGIRFIDHTAAGATTDDVLRFQVPSVDRDEAPAVVTITAGGNDMLMHLRAPRPPVRLIAGICERLSRITDETVQRRPNAIVLLGTVYHPPDGTNGREAEWLARVNEHIRAVCDAHRNVHLADIPAHSAPPEVAERWMSVLRAYHAEDVREQVR